MGANKKPDGCEVMILLAVRLFVFSGFPATIQAGGKPMFIYLPLLVCILGALVYGLSANPKVQEMGRIAYAFGLLVFLFEVAGRGVNLLR